MKIVWLDISFQERLWKRESGIEWREKSIAAVTEGGEEWDGNSYKSDFKKCYV